MSKSKEQIANLTTGILSEILGTDESQIDRNKKLEHFGLSSSSSIGLLGEIEDFVDIDISPSILFENDTVTKLSDYIFNLQTERAV
jgi:acyl carrier protein